MESRIKEITNNVSELISNGNIEDADFAINDAVASGINHKELVPEIVHHSIDRLSDKFNSGNVYLPTLVRSSCYISKLTDIMDTNGEKMRKKTVVIGTVLGDVHDIGKNLCAAALKCAGYNVVDLGCNVSPEDFIKSAKDTNSRIIAVSAPMSTTKNSQRTIVNQAKIDLDNTYVLIGGASCTQKWCDTIKADGYTKDWKEFVDLVKAKIGD